MLELIVLLPVLIVLAVLCDARELHAARGTVDCSLSPHRIGT
jgi:hypothetical protein